MYNIGLLQHINERQISFLLAMNIYFELQGEYLWNKWSSICKSQLAQAKLATFDATYELFSAVQKIEFKNYSLIDVFYDEHKQFYRNSEKDTQLTIE